MPRNTKEVGGMVAIAALLCACGSDPRLRVNDSVLERITIENQLLLFDAENALDIAIDDRDQVLDVLESLENDKARVEAERKAAKRDADLFREKGDANGVEVAELRVEVAEAQLAHLEARKKAEKIRLEARGRALVAARARFELAKARLVKRNNVPGAADIELAKFEEQVTKYEARVAELDDVLEAAEAEVEMREAEWDDVAAELRDASGGAFGSRWLD